MAIYSLINTIDYICDMDKASSNPTIFKIKPLDPIMMSYILDKLMPQKVKPELTKPITFSVKTMKQFMIEAVRFGLMDWHNFLDESDQELMFDRQVITIEINYNTMLYSTLSIETICKIPDEIIQELGAKILDISKTHMG